MSLAWNFEKQLRFHIFYLISKHLYASMMNFFTFCRNSCWAVFIYNSDLEIHRTNQCRLVYKGDFSVRWILFEVHRNWPKKWSGSHQYVTEIIFYLFTFHYILGLHGERWSVSGTRKRRGRRLPLVERDSKICVLFILWLWLWEQNTNIGRLGWLSRLQRILSPQGYNRYGNLFKFNILYFTKIIFSSKNIK